MIQHMNLRNIHLDSPSTDFTRASLGCETDDARYHVWVKLPTLELEHGDIREWRPPARPVYGPPILYKNPLGGKWPDGTDGTRKLNSNSRPSQEIINAMINYALGHDLIDKLRHTVAEREAAEKAERERQAAIKRAKEAGPDLLAALEQVWYQATGQYDKKPCGHPFTCGCGDALATAAIQKARL